MQKLHVNSQFVLLLPTHGSRSDLDLTLDLFFS